MKIQKPDWELSDREYIEKYGQEWYAFNGKPNGPPGPPPPAWKVWAFGLGLVTFMALLLTYAFWRDSHRAKRYEKNEPPAHHVGR